jgi:hypothetical protein
MTVNGLLHTGANPWFRLSDFVEPDLLLRLRMRRSAVC